jgi:catechol 2,3-dioxygenase
MAQVKLGIATAGAALEAARERASMNQDLLAADTAMGAVTLLVDDLDAQTRYYRDAVQLTVLSADGATVTLGRGGTPIVILQHSPGLAHRGPHDAGLFHTAIVFESQASLAAAIYSVAAYAPGTFTGSADHLVSQAFYFTDPEGNGIELYWDRDRTTWSWTHGQVEMATLYLDPNEFLREHLTEEAMAQPNFGAASVGHVHLQVGDTASAREFYVNRLGFDATATLGTSALFVSAGGYHHHMAMNTWNSAGAGRRAPSLGLGRVDILVPGADDLGALAERMSHYGVQTRDDGRTLSFEDPWANAIRVVAETPATSPRP